MLTADLVHARRKGGELVLIALDDAARARAEELAAGIVAACAAHVGCARAELDAALGAIDVPARDKRVKDGLAKLALDRCELDADDEVDAPALRRALFTRAAEARRAMSAPGAFPRAALVEDAARAHGLAPDALERALFADLRQEHRLRAFQPISARALVDAWTVAQAQAALLRAVRVTVDIERATPGAVRALFRRLKFLRLLFTLERHDAARDGGWRVTLDGPFSLFESSTKYGLQLALALPALDACDAWKLTADLRWGKDRAPLTFRLESAARARAAHDDAPLPDEVAQLARTFAALDSGWRVSPATDVLDLPGVGVCVPDLVFEKGGARVHLEVMGYWSRDAVWKRVELVENGLGARILFAVSARLRVSEAVLGEDVPGALYVYKGAMNARAVLEKLELLAKRR